MGQNDINPYDKRLARRAVETGMLTQEQVDEHIKNLPDESANADWVTLDLEESELAGSDSLVDVTLEDEPTVG